MEHTIDNTLEYIIFLTRHIRKGNVPGAILAVLMELGFPEYCDGFGYLRKAIYIKYCDSCIRFSAIYLSIAQKYSPGADSNQIEQDIRAVINLAWKVRDTEKWCRFFPTDKNGWLDKPSNGRFIARFACLMELWNDIREEVSYAAK